MPCERVQIDGAVAIVCSRGRRSSARCCICGELGADRLCDGPGERAGTTCDRPLHRRCAITEGERDLCREHRHHQAQLGLSLSPNRSTP